MRSNVNSFDIGMSNYLIYNIIDFIQVNQFCFSICVINITFKSRLSYLRRLERSLNSSLNHFNDGVLQGSVIVRRVHYWFS